MLKNRGVLFVTTIALIITAIPLSIFAAQKNNDIQEESIAGSMDEEEVLLNEEYKLRDAEEISEYISAYIDEGELVDTFELVDDKYMYEGEVIDFSIPRDIDDAITLAYDKNNVISVGLPENINCKEPSVSEDGTIAYFSNDGTALAIQGTIEGNAGNTEEGIRCVVTLENDQCDKSYSYTFENGDDCKLVSGNDFVGEQTQDINPGSYYLVSCADEDIITEDNIIMEIESAWAYDANGTPVQTYYSINENVLTQYIETNENTEFPVVADPKGKVSAKVKYRAMLIEVAGLGRARGYNMAARFLEDSLKDNPTNKKYPDGGVYSNKIKKSSEYKAIMKKTKESLKKNRKSTYNKSGSAIFDSTTDLYMAINAAQYTVKATKQKRKWHIIFTLKDRYDFAYKKMGEGLGWRTKAGIILNNYAVKAQKAKAVIPYYNYITVKSTY